MCDIFYIACLLWSFKSLIYNLVILPYNNLVRNYFEEVSSLTDSYRNPTGYCKESSIISCKKLVITLCMIFKPGTRQPQTGFLRIASVHERLYACVFASVCVCPTPRLLITSGVMWCDINPM